MFQYNSLIFIILVNIWRARRRHLNKCFKQRQMCGYVPLFNEFSNQLKNNLPLNMRMEQLGDVTRRSFFNNFFGEYVCKKDNKLTFKV